MGVTNLEVLVISCYNVLFFLCSSEKHIAHSFIFFLQMCINIFVSVLLVVVVALQFVVVAITLVIAGELLCVNVYW